MAKGDVDYLKSNNIEVNVEDSQGLHQRANNTIVSNNVDVTLQSSINPVWQYFLMQEQKTDITLTSAIAENDDVINVSAGHGFTAVAGEYIVVRCGDLFLQMEVKSVASDAITVFMPIDTDFPDNCSVMRGNINMNVNGSITPVDFEFTSDKNGGVDPVIPIDMATVKITMQHATAGDDSLFGNLAALTNGFYFRKKDGSFMNFGNYKSNQKFKDLGAKVTYTDKAGGGNFSTEIEFDLKEIFTQEVRLDPRTVDKILGKVRDNIALLKFTVSFLGSLTIGE